MKRLSLLGLLLLCFGLTGASYAQTAAQYIGAGNQSYAAKDYVKGAQYYQAAVQLDANSAAAYQGLGNCQYMLGKNAEALAAYEKASSLDPNNAQLSSFVQTLKAKVGTPAPAAAPPAGSAAAMAASPSSGESKFELDFGAGLAISSLTGFGGSAAGFVPLGTNFSLGGNVGFYTFGQSASGYGASASSSLSFLEVLAAGKYRFGSGSFEPYIVGGVGMALFMESVTVSGFGSNLSASASEMDPMISVGGGVEFAAGSNMHIFIQGRYSMVMSNGLSQTYEPIEAGINLGL